VHRKSIEEICGIEVQIGKENEKKGEELFFIGLYLLKGIEHSATAAASKAFLDLNQTNLECAPTHSRSN
jgi:hypothetical protein